MRLLVNVIRYELLLQLRSGRFRLAVALYTALSALPPAMMLLFIRRASCSLDGEPGAPTRPHTALLDPDRTCYRWQTPGSPALERVNLLD